MEKYWKEAVGLSPEARGAMFTGWLAYCSGHRLTWETGLALRALGHAETELKAWDAAVTNLERSFDVFCELERWRDACEVALEVGRIWMKEDRKREAVRVCREAVKVAVNVGDPMYRARVLRTAGHVAFRVGDRAKWREWWQQACRGFEDQGKHDEALRLQIQQAKLAVDKGDRSLCGESLEHRVRLLQVLRQHDVARRLRAQVRSIRSRKPDDLGWVRELDADSLLRSGKQ